MGASGNLNPIKPRAGCGWGHQSISITSDVRLVIMISHSGVMLVMTSLSGVRLVMTSHTHPWMHPAFHTGAPGQPGASMIDHQHGAPLLHAWQHGATSMGRPCCMHGATCTQGWVEAPYYTGLGHGALLHRVWSWRLTMFSPVACQQVGWLSDRSCMVAGPPTLTDGSAPAPTRTDGSAPAARRIRATSTWPLKAAA